ncbi:MAG: hypothetical protein IJV65_07935 [Kiritimatiellae bacterium]|nr:hypothetical protein [Kiritimatiellia bacterium]
MKTGRSLADFRAKVKRGITPGCIAFPAGHGTVPLHEVSSRKPALRQLIFLYGRKVGEYNVKPQK